MTTRKSILSRAENNGQLSVVAYKAIMLKRRIILTIATESHCTIADLSRILNVSNPTITKLIGELIDEGYVRDAGKIETKGGRRPSVYGLVPDSGYFMGVSLDDDTLTIGAVDLDKNLTGQPLLKSFRYSNNDQLIDGLTAAVKEFSASMGPDAEKILGLGIAVKGRVDADAGLVYNAMNPDGFKLAEAIARRTGMETIVENDTRAMTYAEYLSGTTGDVQNALYINVGGGIGAGIIINGKLYYGKSGFSGEFGHIPFFENDIICHCGKKGCLETEASGASMVKTLTERLAAGASSILADKYKHGEEITIHDVIEATAHDDVLSIDMITHVGEKLGRGISILINLFNPQMVVIGGTLSEVGDYLMLPIRTALNKYSLRLVTRDSSLTLSALGDNAGVLGAALLTRNRMLGIL